MEAGGAGLTERNQPKKTKAQEKREKKIAAMAVLVFFFVGCKDFPVKS